MEVTSFETLDGLYDCAWSEENENIVLACSGDGSLFVFDLGLPPECNPLRRLQEHKHEACSVNWNMLKRDLFLSSSWDDSVKLWSLASGPSLRTFTGHSYCVYQATWNPAVADVFLSCSGDTSVRVWDLRQPGPTLVLPAHAFEVLTADWCKYNDCLIATGSVDKSIKVWDVRMTQRELIQLIGHSYAVRRVLWSPHSDSLIASCSYDMTVKLWRLPGGMVGGGPPMGGMGDGMGPMLQHSWGHHHEFCVGLDWSMLTEGLLGSAGWDQSAWLFRANEPVAVP